jgi:hypothetical protein
MDRSRLARTGPPHRRGQSPESLADDDASHMPCLEPTHAEREIASTSVHSLRASGTMLMEVRRRILCKIRQCNV